MPWKTLPDDVPLDHEELKPPQPLDHVDAPPVQADPVASGNFAPLPDDAQLDNEIPPEPPAIVGAVRSHPGAVNPEEVNPTYTEAGFDGEIHPDTHYHSELSKADKQEYANFFKDPKSPPSAAALGLWYHQKTGAYLANAQDIVDTFKKTGKFSTAEKISLPTKHQGAIASGLNHMANSAGFDWGPELAAPLDALGLGGSDRPNVFNSDESFGNLVANNADLERAQLEQDSADRPIASTLGELAGVVPASLVGGAVADAAKLGKLGETNANLVRGYGEGFAYGSGAAGPGHRMEGGAEGGAMVPAVGAVAKLPAAAIDTGRTVLQGSPGMARRIIAKSIAADMNTPESAGKAISDAHANDVPMALGDTGENARGLLAATSRSSGVARTIARDALDTRQNELADRVVGHVERDLGPVANPHQVADNLMTTARNDAEPLYEKAYASPGAQAFGEKIKPLLDRPSMKRALGKAYRIAAEEGRDPETLGFSKFRKSDSPILGADGKPMQVDEVKLTKIPSWQTLDYIKRGMDDVIEGYRDTTTGKLHLDTEGRAINNTQRSFLGAFDKANPDYAAARQAWAGPVSAISAMNLGRKALNMTADDLEARIRDLTPGNKQMFALGLRRAMARAFGDRKQFQRFVDTLGQEREGFRSFKQARLGSPTAPNQMDDAALAVATGAAEAVVGGLSPLTAMRYALKFGFGKLGEKAKQQVAAMLSNTDPAAIRELARELRSQADKRGLRIHRVNVVTSGVGKGAVVALPRQQAQ
jgi:hypothetical protein